MTNETMHNMYFSSTTYAVRCKEPLSLSFNGYSNLWYERFDRTLSHCSSCCGCCDCCALSIYRVPIKPSLFTGLRQSTLLQLSASRRFILGRDRYFSRLSAYGLDRSCYDLNCSVNERTVCYRSRMRKEGKHVCLRAASQKGRENCHSFDSDDAEAVLSLLSEGLDKDAVGINWKNVSSSKRMEAEKRKKVSKERNLSLSKKTETDNKGNLKQHYTSTFSLRREDGKSNRERESFTKNEGHRKQRDASSCSSYYSLSSGDFGSDVEVHDNHALEELSAGYEKDEANHVKGQVKEEFNRQRDDSEMMQDVSKQEITAFGADIDWNLRKKSEKKLADVTVQEAKSTKEHQDMHSRARRTHEASYGKASLSCKQLDNEEHNSSFVTDQKAYSQTGKRTHQSTNIQVSGGDEVETSLLSQKSSGREGKLGLSETMLKETSGERKIFVGSTSVTREDVINRSSQQYIGNSKFEDIERTSNATMKNLGAKKVSVLSSAQGVEEQQLQKGESIITQAKERRKSQQFSETSQVYESHVEDTSIGKSRTRIKNWEEHVNLSSDARSTWQQTDKRIAQKGYELACILSEGNTSDEKQVSSSQRTSEKVRFTPKGKLMTVAKTRDSSSQADEKIVHFELARKDRRTSDLSIFDETASREESNYQGSLNCVSGAGKHVILEDVERSSAIVVIPSTSQLTGGSTNVEHTAGIASPDILLQTSESGSSALYDDTGGSPAFLSVQYSRDGSGHAYREPSNIMAPEDALGSADRLEKSSKQHVDEFVERVRHEVTTPETQERENTGTKLTFEDEGVQIHSSKNQGIENDSTLREHGSIHSSGFRGTKGPSNEMWDVTEPSVEQSMVAEEPEISKETEKQIVGRTGRSLWSMIADVVRLRWGSRAGSSTSAGRSGERNSPNKSDSETWFSGQEHEEPSKSNVIKETSVLPLAMTFDKLKLGKHYTLGEEEESDTKRIKDKGKHLEVGSSSPHTLESGSVVASSVSGVESAGWTEGGKDLKVNTSSVETMELPISLPAVGPPIAGEIVNVGGPDLYGTESVVPIKERVAPVQSELFDTGRKDGELKQRKLQRREEVDTPSIGNKELPFALPARGPPIAGEIVNIGGPDLYGTELVVPIKEPAAPVQSELSDTGRKDGELKQRKFQRNTQVLRDRFDDWEEAYKLELEQQRMDELFMKEALLEAKKAADTWEVPVGAVLVQNGKIIARGCNLVEELRDSTAHAEMICIRDASNFLRTWRLSDTTLYVTLEPCPMCAGAILQARVDTVVWGAPNKLLGADGSWIRIFPDGGESASNSRDMPPAPVHPFHPNMKIRRGVLANECADVMQQFFQFRRKKKKEESPKGLSVTHHHSKFLNKIHDIFHVMFCL